MRRYPKKQAIAFMHTHTKKARFHIIGVDSGVGVEVYKYSFLEDSACIDFLKRVAMANPEIDIEIEFTSFFDHDDIDKREYAAQDGNGATIAAMSLVRKAARLEPDIIVGSCNTLNTMLISKQRGKSPYQMLIEEGVLQYNSEYREDVTRPIHIEMLQSVQTPIFSCGILDATAHRIYQRSIYGMHDNVIKNPVVSHSVRKRKAAIIIFSTEKTAQDGIYDRIIQKLHRENVSIEMQVIQKGVTRARRLNANPDPSGQDELKEQVHKDGRAVIDDLMKEFSINELIEMSPIQVGFCCTHFPLVKEIIMDILQQELMRSLLRIDVSTYQFKNEIDEELMKEVLAGNREIVFQPIVQGPDLLPQFITQFRLKYDYVLNSEAQPMDAVDGIVDNIRIISSVYGKTGPKIPRSSFEDIQRLKYDLIYQKYLDAGIRPTYIVVYDDKTSC